METIIDEIFGNSVSSQRRRRKLKYVLAGYLTKIWANNGDTGVVFAGFGHEEHFPAVCSYECRGMTDGVVWRTERQNEKVHEKCGAILIPFAQADVAHTFLSGIDPEFRDVIERMMRSSFSDLKRVARNRDVSSAADSILNTFFEEFGSYQREKHVVPMVDVLTVLPKDELGRLAESLVEITSLKRHVTEDQETVGGPIDVAVISKGDGFIWISRKHYFDAATNPDYFLRQRRRQEGGAREEKNEN
ncbi:MAG: hypothetical protein HN403_19690 [Rhodospirillales bacterium]|nr:hypothetical protein [Rhodospirillales bacterium]